jgi:hypothetical protein
LELFRYGIKVSAKLAKLVPLTNMLRRNFAQRTHLIHSIGSKTHVLGHFGAFCYCTKVGAKWTKLVSFMHKLDERSCVGIFRNERTRSTPLDPKLMF